MHVGSWHLARLHEGVEALDGDLRAAKSKMVQPLKRLGLGERRKDECGPQHAGR